MIPTKYSNVLRELYLVLKETNIAWAITGSTAFLLHGMAFQPNDIDLQTDRQGAYQMEELFREYVTAGVEQVSDDYIRCYSGSLEIEGMKVEIIGDFQKNTDGIWENPVDVRKKRRFITLYGMPLPVLDLEYEYDTYIKMGRAETAARLQRYMRLRRFDKEYTV